MPPRLTQLAVDESEHRRLRPRGTHLSLRRPQTGCRQGRQIPPGPKSPTGPPARACGGTSASRGPAPQYCGRVPARRPPPDHPPATRPVATTRLFPQALRADRLEVPGHRRVEQGRPGRLGVHDLLEGLGQVFAREERPGRSRARTKSRPGRRRRYAGRRAADQASACSGAMLVGVPSTAPECAIALRVRLLGQAEVGCLGDAVLNRCLESPGQQNVRRLRVAVDDSLSWA